MEKINQLRSKCKCRLHFSSSIDTCDLPFVLWPPKIFCETGQKYILQKQIQLLSINDLKKYPNSIKRTKEQ